jgi:hypothetical protein
LASAPLSPDDVPIVIETMAVVARELGEMTPRLRATLKTLPLWTWHEWRMARPIYAIEDESVASAVAGQAPVWQPGFTLDGAEPLLEALNVTYIPPSEFRPVAEAGYGAAQGEAWRPRFALAVEHLRTELARRDLDLYKTLATSWEELAATILVLDRELEVVASVPGRRRLVAPARAHLVRGPLAMFVRSVDDIGSAEAGGQAIASLFNGARHTVAWAWASMWQRAGAGEVAASVVLSTDLEIAEDDDRLGKLKTQADTRRQGGTQKRAALSEGSRGNGSAQVQVRKLKELVGRLPGAGEVVNKGAPRGGVIIPKRQSRPGGGTGAGSGGRTDSGNGASPGNGSRSPVLPAMSER